MPALPPQFSRITISYDKVLVRLGYARGKTQVDRNTEALIHEEIALAEKLVQPRQVTASSTVTIEGSGTVSLEPGLVIISTKIRDLLKDCSVAEGFAVTIGANIEEKRNLYLAAKDTTRALIIDAAGSVAAEELAELTHEQIQRSARERGGEATRRFSPGYGDWQLSSQKDFLQWLGAAQIGIRLTESFEMLPEKSVSAIVGVVTANSGKR